MSHNKPSQSYAQQRYDPRIAEMKQLLQQRQYQRVIERCESILTQEPHSSALALLLNQAYQANGQFEQMLSHCESLLEIDSESVVLKLRHVECLLYCGETAQALSELDELARCADDNLQLLNKLAELYLSCTRYDKVADCHRKVLSLAPDNPQYQYNLASSRLFLGDIDQAKILLDSVIEQSPQDFDAYYARVSLGKQTNTNNHIDLLKQRYQQYQHIPAARICLGYSLAKVLEDIGSYQQSFNYLTQAAEARRAQLAYQVQNDVTAMQHIIDTFSETAVSQIASVESSAKPVFILGLPRTGSTLVERILSSHDQLSSIGESNHLVFSLLHCVGPNVGKLDLITQSIGIDFKLLAQYYQKAIAGYGMPTQLVIDKTPTNFLYLGLIRLAFPNAKVIHIQRHPMDSCYAIYKTLFRMGYPYSYDLSDLGHYYFAYRRLMAHWRKLFGDYILDVDYQALVNNPEPETRRILDYCELDWQPSVLNFTANKTATATASAAQVRQPIYTSSVARWRCYETQLMPLYEQLTEAGIHCD